MNEKAIESMNKDEPETALEFLKKVDETLIKLESSTSTSDLKKQTKDSINSTNIENGLDPNYKATLYYNLACCY